MRHGLASTATLKGQTDHITDCSSCDQSVKSRMLIFLRPDTSQDEQRLTLAHVFWLCRHGPTVNPDGECAAGFEGCSKDLDSIVCIDETSNLGTAGV